MIILIFVRRRALEVWKNRVGPDCTYRKLLKICAEGNMHDSAMVIVKFFTESNGMFENIFY